MFKLNPKFFIKNLGDVHRYIAFTLAEVLITLGIIGVVAAMTIPTLMQKTQDKELRVALKKSFSILSQATEMLQQENGGDISGAFNDTNYSVSMKSAYAPYLKAAKICDNVATDGCFSPSVHALDGSTAIQTDIGGGYPGLVVADGASYMFTSAGSTVAACKPGANCGQIYLDINGLKKPNVLGRDVFVFNLKYEGLTPVGQGTDYSNCEADTGHYAGVYCTAKYVLQ